MVYKHKQEAQRLKKNKMVNFNTAARSRPLWLFILTTCKQFYYLIFPYFISATIFLKHFYYHYILKHFYYLTWPYFILPTCKLYNVKHKLSLKMIC